MEKPEITISELETIHHLGLYIAQGAFTTSPIESLHRS